MRLAITVDQIQQYAARRPDLFDDVHEVATPEVFRQIARARHAIVTAPQLVSRNQPPAGVSAAAFAVAALSLGMRVPLRRVK